MVSGRAGFGYTMSLTGSGLAATPFSIDGDAGRADVFHVPTLLADGFAEKIVIAQFHQAPVWPVERTDGRCAHQPATADDKIPAAIPTAAVLEIKVALATRPPRGGRK